MTFSSWVNEIAIACVVACSGIPATHETSSTWHAATEVTRQPHQILHLPQKMIPMIDLCHICDVIYNLRARGAPTSPNIVLATKNDSHDDWSSSHMNHLHCAEQQVSRPNLTKFCLTRNCANWCTICFLLPYYSFALLYCSFIPVLPLNLNDVSYVHERISVTLVALRSNVYDFLRSATVAFITHVACVALPWPSFPAIHEVHPAAKCSKKGLRMFETITHNFYRHIFVWFIFSLPCEMSGTASCGTMGIHFHLYIFVFLFWFFFDTL